MKEYRRIGDLVDLIDERIKDEKVKTLIGVSIDKCFIKSVANTIGTDLSKYQVIRKFDFACSLMQVSRDGKIPIACLKDYDEAIMSPAYYIFRIKNTEEILTDYMAMWFMRPEFDREASYIAVGGVRGSMPWEDFCDMKLPVPDIKEQQKIVDTYNAITNRIQIKQKINENLEKTALLQIEELLENPNTKKRTIRIGDICDVKGGKRLPLGSDLIEQKNSHPYIRIRDLKNSCFVVLNDEFLYVDDETQQEISRYITNTNDLLISIVGTIGLTSIVHSSLDNANLTENCVKLTSMQKLFPEYVLMYLRTKSGQKAISQATVGAVQAKLPLKNVQNLDIQYFDDDQMKEINLLLKNSFKLISCNIEEIIKLNTLRNGIVSQISKR